jgi:fatty-acid desaturase
MIIEIVLSVCSHSVALFIGSLSVLGATAGAHRLWAHRTYTANIPLRVLLMICQTLLGQVSKHSFGTLNYSRSVVNRNIILRYY